MPTSLRPRLTVMGTVKLISFSACTWKLAWMIFWSGKAVVGEFDAQLAVESFAGIQREGEDARA